MGSYISSAGIGYYPPEYNPKVHGPYSPGVHYGKLDTKFTQVQLKDLPQWLGRRGKSPAAMFSCFGREKCNENKQLFSMLLGIFAWACQRYLSKYVQVRRGGGMIPMAHLALVMYFSMYYVHHNRHYAHRHSKYH